MFHIIDVNVDGQSAKVRSFRSEGAYKAALANETPEGYIRTKVDKETDLNGMSGPHLLAVLNSIRVGLKPIKTMHSRNEMVPRVYKALEAKVDPEDVALEPATATQEDTPADETAPASAEATTTAASADAEPANEETDTMATTKKTKATKGKKVAAKNVKAAPKAKAPKAAKAKAPRAASTANRDEFGLLVGSKNSQAAKLFARAKGATMADVKEAVGDTKYNLLKQLAEAGHKVQKEDKTIFLTVKK